MTNPEIPQPAVEIAAEKIWRLIWEDDDFKPFSEASKESREICLEGAEELLAAALPHLRVQETPATEHDSSGMPVAADCPARHPETGKGCIEPPGHDDGDDNNHRAMGTERLQWFGANLQESDSAAAADAESVHLITTNGTGYFWCSCSRNHARVFRGLREHVATISSPAPHPRPVVDREALLAALAESDDPEGWPAYERQADAVLALLPTEEGEGSKDRNLVCGRCKSATNNTSQGHYWRLCKVTGGKRQFHFCCPGDCELDAEGEGS